MLARCSSGASRCSHRQPLRFYLNKESIPPQRMKSHSRPLWLMLRARRVSTSGMAWCNRPVHTPGAALTSQAFVRTSHATSRTTERSPPTRPVDALKPYHPQSACSGPYQAPNKGLLSYLPASIVPYAELMRLDKPAGTYYLFFPCLFSTLLAASYTGAPAVVTLTTSLLFFTGALIMRGAGCTINDLWDRNLDPHVARTRNRPIARGAVTPIKAVVFTGFQLLAGLGILVQFPVPCLYYGIPSLLLVTTYPLAKRVTNYPQFVLGLTFSWGAIMGFPALGVDLLADTTALKAVAALYASCISWTVLYDMIYAHMDIRDDANVGIKSIALRHANETKIVLTGLAIAQIGFLATAGAAIGASPMFFIGSCGSAALTLAIMIHKVKLKDVNNCWWWFKNGAFFTGGGIASGLLAEYMLESQAEVKASETVAA